MPGILNGSALPRLLGRGFLAAGGEDLLDWTVRFTTHPPLWFIVLVVIPWTTALVWWIYRGESVRSSFLRWVMIGLRTAIVLLVLGILLQPVIVHTRSRTEKPSLAILVDTSASMSSKDKYVDERKRSQIRHLAGLTDSEPSDHSRIDLVSKILENPRLRILETLGEKADLKLYTFSGDVSAVANLSDVESHGPVTRLGDALQAVHDEYRGRRLASIIVLSDGRSNEGRDPFEVGVDLAADSVPLITVGVGDPDTPRDVSIHSVTAPQSVLKDDEVIFQISVQSIGFENQNVDVELIEAGQTVASRPLILEGSGRQQKVILYYRASEPGHHQFTVRVRPLEGESILENNERQRTLDVIQKKIRVLYVEGYPRWEYRYLKTALVRDVETMEATCQLLSADAEFVQASSPSIDPLAPGQLPRGKDLFEYDVVLFGDVDPYELGATESERNGFLEDVVTLVEELGGGFAMIAGEKDSPHHYRGTPLERLLPVVIDAEDGDLPVGLNPDTAFRAKLTDLGRSHEITLLESDPDEAALLFDEYLPGFYWFSPVKKAKAGATVLAVHPEARNSHGPLPIFVAQFYASGRTFFSAVDSTWRWRMGQGDRHFYRFWSQVIRFVGKNRLGSRNKRAEIFLDKSEYHVGEKVTVTATMRDQDFRPSEKASQPVELRSPSDRDPRELLLQPSKTKPGTYSLSFPVREIGSHRIWIEADAEDAGEESVNFDVVIPSMELENPVLDRPSLERLAETTRGRFLSLDELGELADIPRCDPVIVPSVIVQEELWDKWGVLGLLGALLVLEWILRKRQRLL